MLCRVEDLSFVIHKWMSNPLLPGDRGGVLFHVVTTLLGRKSCWLLEVADVDYCSLEYDDAKNHKMYIIYHPIRIAQSPHTLDQHNTPSQETAIIARPQPKL